MLNYLLGDLALNFRGLRKNTPLNQVFQITMEMSMEMAKGGPTLYFCLEGNLSDQISMLKILLYVHHVLMYKVKS